MQEGLSAEHGRELVGDALEELLNGGRVPDKCDRHLEPTRWDVAVSGLDVVGAAM